MSEPQAADLALRERVGREVLGYHWGECANQLGWYELRDADGKQTAARGQWREDYRDHAWEQVPPWELSLDACKDVRDKLAEQDYTSIIQWHPDGGVYVSVRKTTFTGMRIAERDCPRGHEARTLCELALRVLEGSDGK